MTAGRAPHGARGLKPGLHGWQSAGQRSRPAWDAWIETVTAKIGTVTFPGRAPHGARGLKPEVVEVEQYTAEVAPRMGRVD